MTGRSLRIGHLAGIPIGISPLWLLIVALITVSLGASYYPQEVDGNAGRGPGQQRQSGLIACHADVGAKHEAER